MQSVSQPPLLPPGWLNVTTLVFALGCIVFGALFYGSVIALALVWRLPLLYVFALCGVGVCYLSYFAQGTGLNRRLCQGLVYLSIVVGAVCLVVLVEALVAGTL